MNIFQDLPNAAQAEVFETILESAHARIERIITQGQVTPKGQWLSQSHVEWVMVAQGRAKIVFEADSREYALASGDCLHIPKNCRHCVEWTDPNQPTVWLAVHIGDQST